MSNKLTTTRPVMINGWIVQGSILNNQTICLVIYHTESQHTFVRYFSDEMRAHMFVNEIVYGGVDVEDDF